MGVFRVRSGLNGQVGRQSDEDVRPWFLTEIMMTRTARALMLGTALMTLAAPAVAFAQSASPMQVHAMAQQPALNLSAYGEVKVAPDQATINFGVVTEAATAQEAMAQNAQQMTRVVAALRRAGVAERDIQTSGLNLSAQYDYQQNEPPKLRGYQVQNRVTVIINDLTKVGSTADAVVTAGVNQIDGISFGLKDAKAAEDQARQLAVRALQDKARLYAQALGVQLGGVRSLTEGGGFMPEPPRPMPMYARAMDASGAATPVSAGELTVRIDISGVYDIGR
ncbi:uncharacterized protein YggE [Brevundimonas faecalis]|uniref:Uncharacterized protein YggE n=2 Tax=Brevundimonas faecalis TaxID=947378 RepID=A0ABV2R8K3_9CAUL